MAEKNEPTDKERPRVSDDELRAAFAGPAFHSNKIYLSMMQGGARVAFMEQQGAAVSPTFRTAVLLSYPDVLALRDLITRLLSEIEPQIKEAEKAQKAVKESGEAGPATDGD